MIRRESPTQPQREPGRPWSLDAASRYLGISRRGLERLIAAGRVASIRLGCRHMIADDEVRRVATQGTGQVA